MIKFRALASLLIVTAVLPAATVAPAENTKQLQGAIGADRDTYFPGEAAIFTVTLRNPGQAALEVPEPLSGDNGCFALRKRDQRGALVPVVARPICPNGSAESNAPAITTLGSGEQRKGSVSADVLTHGLSVSGGGPASPTLNAPGSYQLEYLYYNLHSTVAFQVVPAHLDASAVTRLRDISYKDPDSGKPVHLTTYVRAFALRWKNQTYICVSQGPGANSSTVTGDANGDYTNGDFPYVRIAATPDPVTSIVVNTDAQNRLIVMWQDAKKVWRSRMLLSYPLDPARVTAQVKADHSADALNAAQNNSLTAGATALAAASLR